jgi:hypothetical protein
VRVHPLDRPGKGFLVVDREDRPRFLACADEVIEQASFHFSLNHIASDQRVAFFLCAFDHAEALSIQRLQLDADFARRDICLR